MRLCVTLLVTGLAVILQDYLASGYCSYDNALPCVPPTPVTYRADGRCNNMIKRVAGSKNSPYNRYLSHMLTGGTGSIPYTSLYGTVLSTPRDISVKVFPCGPQVEIPPKHLFVIFGKLLMVDMFSTKRADVADKCCPSCLGIDAIPNDPRVTCPVCTEYNKIDTSQNIDCRDDTVEGVNQVTHVIDGSFIFDNADLQMGINANANKKIPTPSGFRPIVGTKFVGVDDHINQNPLLMALYHVFIREYNKLVDKMIEFGYAEPSEEAKKLLIAILQHITYSEYITIFLGTDTIAKSLTTGTLTYDSTKLPILSNSFTLAYKLAMASMLREQVTIGTVKDLITIMNNAENMNDDTEMLDTIKGMLNDASYKIDNNIPCVFRNNCNYKDIVSIVTQDTRLLGIPPYMVWVALTSNVPITTIDSFPHQSDANKALLKSVYPNAVDVDFLSGIFTETHVPLTEVGPTLHKLFTDQFINLKQGDRFYYENDGAFTPKQLEEIRKVTMAHILCRNVVNLVDVRRNAFVGTSPEVKCADIPYIDFCNYANYLTWGPWTTTTAPCAIFQIKYRICLSTKPALCPCIGHPLEIMPCPNNILDEITLNNIETLRFVLQYDTEVLNYLNNRTYNMLNARVYTLFHEIVASNP